MPLTLEIPDNLVLAMRLPRMEVSAELKKEMALGLYQRGALTAGKACELAGVSRWAFEDLLVERKITRPFALQELENDLRVADAVAAERRADRPPSQ